MNNPVHRFSLHFRTRKAKKMSGLKKVESVLEIGCGEGQGAKNILRLFQPSHYMAIDLDPKMISRAKMRLSDKRVNFSVGDATNLDFAKNNFYDVVFDFGIIHHIPNWQDCLKEVHRVLKPDGTFYIEDFSIETFTKPLIGKGLRRILDHPYREMYSFDELMHGLNNAGFKILKVKRLKPYAFWIVAKKLNKK